MTIAVPSLSIDRVAHVFWKDIKTPEGKASVFIEGQTIPLVHMADIFVLEKEEGKKVNVFQLLSPDPRGKRLVLLSANFYMRKRLFSGNLKDI